MDWRPLYASATKCAYGLTAQLVQRGACLREPRPHPGRGFFYFVACKQKDRLAAVSPKFDQGY